MKIVEFENGKFAIRVSNFFERLTSKTLYLDRNTNETWGYTAEGIKRHCLFNSFNEAEKRLNEYKNDKIFLKVKKVY